MAISKNIEIFAWGILIFLFIMFTKTKNFETVYLILKNRIFDTEQSYQDADLLSQTEVYLQYSDRNKGKSFLYRASSTALIDI